MCFKAGDRLIYFCKRILIKNCEHMQDMLSALVHFSELDEGHITINADPGTLIKILQLMEHDSPKFDECELLPALDLSTQWGFSRGVEYFKAEILRVVKSPDLEYLQTVNLYDDGIFSKLIPRYCDSTKDRRLTDNPTANSVFSFLIKYYQQSQRLLVTLDTKVNQKVGVQATNMWMSDISRITSKLLDVRSAASDESNIPIKVNGVLYEKGTASQFGATVTGVDTVWTDSMIGGLIVFPSGESGLIVRVTNSTTIVVDVNQIIPQTSYKIYYGSKIVTRTIHNPDPDNNW